MRLFELDNSFDFDDPIKIGVTSALTKIQASIKDSSYDGEFKVKTLLRMLRDSGINITPEQLPELITKEPWSNFIADVNNDRVIFKGASSDDDSESMEIAPGDETVEKMAKRSSKKHKAELT